MVNYKVLMLLYAGNIGDVKCLKVPYTSEFKVPNGGFEGVCTPLLGSKASKPWPLKQSAKYKCHIWSEITQQFTKKKCPNASSL